MLGSQDITGFINLNDDVEWKKNRIELIYLHFLANKHSVIISLLSDLFLRLADLVRPLLPDICERSKHVKMMKYPFVKANCTTFNTSGCCDVAAFVEENKIALAGRNLLIQ